MSAITIPPLTDEERQRQLNMMGNPFRWPRWPKLPVKKVRDPNRQLGGFPLLGCLIDTDWESLTSVPEPVVYDTNPFTNDTGKPPVLEKYATLEALLDAGWVVD